MCGISCFRLILKDQSTISISRSKSPIFILNSPSPAKIVTDRVTDGSSCENRPFVLKPVFPSIFEISEELKHEFGNNCRIRTHIDYNEEDGVLVYEYYKGNLLSLVKNNPDLSIDARKFILREIGLGLKAMHAKHWIHLGAMW